MEKCTRKICFFAHEVHEIRTNVERPYVSPEQLVAATERASMDLRVQAVSYCFPPPSRCQMLCCELYDQ